MDFAFYNMSSIRVFTPMLTFVCAKNRMLWVFHTESKQDPLWIIIFIIETLKNEKDPCKRVRLDEYGSLEKSKDVTNLLLDKYRISMETTGGYTS